VVCETPRPGLIACILDAEGERVAQDSAVEGVRGLILRGDYAPGARLGEVELADALGVSRTPVRQLAAEGLVELVPNKGARVVAWTPDELEQVFELRAQVEGFAAHQAALRATDDDIERLAELATAHMAATSASDRDLERVYELNAAFHGCIAAVAGGASLHGVLGGLVHTVVLHRTLHTFDDAAMERSSRHHLEIVEAIRARDGLWAESVMRAHLLAARAELLGPRRIAPLEEPA
jgi:DNA-binding GntR family transcriptional regulator